MYVIAFLLVCAVLAAFMPKLWAFVEYVLIIPTLGVIAGAAAWTVLFVFVSDRAQFLTLECISAFAVAGIVAAMLLKSAVTVLNSWLFG